MSNSLDFEKKISLSDSLNQLKEIPKEEAVTFGLIVETLGSKGFGILFICLALPSALPIPAAGYSIPFGLVILLLAVQMLSGRKNIWLPNFAKNLPFSHMILEKMVDWSDVFFKKAEHLIRPRLKWINSSFGRSLMAIIVLIMGILMCIPIPTTNTFPAMVIFLIGIGISEDDGLFCLAASLIGIFAVGLYTFIIYFAIQLIQEYGWEGLEQLKDTVKEFIKGFLA